MKNIRWFAAACFMAGSAALLSSCSDDDSSAAVAPQFPSEVTLLEVEEAGGKAELSFAANMGWTLTSSKLWCRFVQDGEAVQMLYGEAGEQKVEIAVGSEAWDFEAAVAEISLNMGGESQVIARVTRDAKVLGIEGLDEENPLVIEYSSMQEGSYVKIPLNANFDWTLTEDNIPGWMTVDNLPLKGYAGRPMDVTFRVNGDAKTSAQSGNITIIKTGTSEEFSFPVEFPGMGERDIEISLENAWGWSVSKDGWEYWKGSITEGVEAERKEFPLEVKISARNNGYQIVRLVNSDFGLMEPDPWAGTDFFKVEDDKAGNIAIQKFDENTSTERSMYVLAFPKTVYETDLKFNVENAMTDDFKDIKDDYQKYIVCNMTQEGEAASASGFEVLKNGYESVECLPGDGGSDLGMVITGNFGIPEDMIFHVKVPVSTYLQINPLLTASQWNPGENGFSGMSFTDADGNDVSEQWNLGMNMTGKYVVEGTPQKTMFIVFPDKSNELNPTAKSKALVIIAE